MLHQLVDVERLLAGLLSRTEQRIDETREAIGLGDDDRCVLVQRAVLELAFEQLRRAAEPAQRIADLVRELAHHRPAATELSQQCILAQDALVLGHVRDLDQHASRPARLIEGTDRHVDNALGRARMAGDVQLAARVWRRGGACPLDERFELLVVAQEILERASAERVPADAEQVLGGLVEVQHGTLAVQPQHAGGESVEDLAELGRRRPRVAAQFGGHRHSPSPRRGRRAGVICRCPASAWAWTAAAAAAGSALPRAVRSRWFAACGSCVVR